MLYQLSYDCTYGQRALFSGNTLEIQGQSGTAVALSYPARFQAVLLPALLSAHLLPIARL